MRIVVAWVLVVSVLAACSGEGDRVRTGDVVLPADLDALPWPTGKYITPTEVRGRSVANDPDMLLLNVVDEVFYNLGHIEDSLKIPYNQLAGRLDEVDRDKHVVVYCRRGVRSETGYDILVGDSYPWVWVMEGGIEAWIALGYPVVP